ANAIERQRFEMSFIRKERWTETELDGLPAGEHNYFERKSGALFEEKGELLGKLAKTVSALANSGGGYIILGVDDAGIPDGVPPMEGRTPIKDWLEQQIPLLVDYALSDFRVHIVERSNPTRIPVDKEVVVIDVGDSPLAPHQCIRGSKGATKYLYYYRQAGHSSPAPNFYLELLRQRLVNPVLEVEDVSFEPLRATHLEDGIFLSGVFNFLLKNTGRVAAYKWGIQWQAIENAPDGCEDSYRFNKQRFPKSHSDNIRMPGDTTILPEFRYTEVKDFGVVLKPEAILLGEVRIEVERILTPTKLTYRLATETSPGEIREIELKVLMPAQELSEFICAALPNPKM
ncbi:MAG TPA: RNA-binding domain-containing protein, partial [Blastocatellia bacterium]|nr:RNA-binding domain-containing protein [Blastocatellia bacterium]